MSSKNLYQLCGIGLLAGGVLAGVGNIAQIFINDQPLSALWVPGYLVLLLGEILIGLSFPAVYVRYARNLGIVGLAGFLLIALSGMILGVGSSLVSAFVDPFLASSAPTLYARFPAPGLFNMLIIAGILFALGNLVFGIIAMLKVQLYRLSALLLIVCGVARVFASTINLGVALTSTHILFDVAVVLFGSILLASTRNEVAPSVAAPVNSQVHAS